MTDRLLVLGAGGMLGSTLLRVLPRHGLQCIGTLRSELPPPSPTLRTGVDVGDLSSWATPSAFELCASPRAAPLVAKNVHVCHRHR